MKVASLAYSKWKGACKGTALGAMESCNWATRFSCCGCFSHLINCCSGLSWLYSSRSVALGHLSLLFPSAPYASRLAQICICVHRMGPLPAQTPFRVFTLLIPFACCRPSTSPKLATIEVAVKEPKEVDETVFKMASHKPPVKHLSSGGSSTCQASVGAERADVQLTPSTGIVSPSSSTTLKSRSLYFLHFTCCLSVISGCLQTLWTTEGSAGVGSAGPDPALNSPLRFHFSFFLSSFSPLGLVLAPCYKEKFRIKTVGQFLS